MIFYHHQAIFILGIQGLVHIYKSVNIIHNVSGLKVQNHMVILTDSEKAFANYSLYNTDFETLKREIEENTGICKDSQY